MANTILDAIKSKDEKEKKAAATALKHNPLAMGGYDEQGAVEKPAIVKTTITPSRAEGGVIVEAARSGEAQQYQGGGHDFSDVAKFAGANLGAGATNALLGINRAGNVLFNKQPNELGQDLANITQRLNTAAEESQQRVGASRFEADTLRGLGQLGAFAPLAAASPLAYAGAVGTSILGNSYDEAIAQGASREQALKYAGTNAVTQGAIESIAGPGAGRVMSGLAAKALPNIGGTIAGGLIKNAAGEGLEEMLGYEAERRIGNAVLDRGQEFSAKEMLYQGAVGATVGGAYGGANIAVGRAAQNKVQTEAQERLQQQDAYPALAVQGAAESNRASGIVPFSEHEANNLSSPKGVVDGKDMAFTDFISRAKELNPATRFYFGKVSDDLAENIKSATGADVSGYGVAIRNDEINHIFKNHGDEYAEAQRGQIAVNNDIMAKIPDVFNDPDSIVLINGRDYGGRFVFEVHKRINGYAIIATGVSDGRKMIEVDSLRVINKKKPPTAFDEAQAPPEQTPETSSRPASYINSIANQADNVNNTQLDWQVNDTGGAQQRGLSANSLPKAAEAGVPGLAEIEAAIINRSSSHYDPQNLADTQAQARERIEQMGLMHSTLDVQRAIQTGKLNSQETAAAVELIKHYAQSTNPGDVAVATKLTEGLMKSATDMGRAINALKLLQKISPEGFLRFATSQFEEAARRSGVQIELTSAEHADLMLLGEIARTGSLPANQGNASQDLQAWLKEAQPYINSGRLDLAQAATGKALALIQNKIPATFRQKFRALQRISLLSNPKTHVRNIGGNLLLGIGETIAHPFAKIFDDVMAKATGQRTVGSGGASARAKGTVEGLKNAAMERKLGIDLQGGKYNEGVDLTFGAKSRAFNDANVVGKFLNEADGFITHLLRLGDEPFRNGQYQSVLAQMMKANNVTQPTAEMIEAAYESSLRRTFQDDNAATELFQNIRNAVAGKGNSPFSVAGDVIAPFVKTPVNVIKVGLEYSPIGMLEAIAKAIYGQNSVKTLRASGESTLALQRQCAELFGRGAVGTGLLFLGSILKMVGMATGDDDENEKERAWAKAQGQKGNALKIGDTYYDVSSLQTLATPLIAGAATSGELNTRQALQAMVSVGNTALEMPVLQGLQELIGGTYSSTSVLEGLLGLGMDAAGQIIPFGSLLRQTAAAADPYARTTASRAETAAGREIESGLNNIRNIFPGAREKLPQTYDVLGRPQMSFGAESTGQRIFNAYLNPLNTSKEISTPVTDELNRLYAETQDRAVLPRLAANDISYNNVPYRFDTVEKQEFQRVEGQKLSEMLQTLISSADYKNADTEQKVKMIKDLQEFAADTAKAEYLDKQGVDYTSTDKWKNSVRELEKAGISNGEAVLIRSVLNSFEDDYDNDKKREYLYGISWLSNEKKKALDDMLITDTGGYTKEVDAQYDSREAFLLSQMSATAQRNWTSVKAAGMNVEEYSRLYPLLSTGNGRKKTDAIADIMAVGYSERQANEFWRLATKDVK